MRNNTMYYRKQSLLYDNLFIVLLPLVVAASFGFAFYLRSCRTVTYTQMAAVSSALNIQYVIQEPVKKIIPVKRKESIEKTIITEEKREPIDLSDKPVLNQEQDENPEKVKNAPVVRRVYGLRKVYSTGLGSGGQLSDAVIGKLGNTLNTPIDTFAASKEEIKGQIVSTTTVTTVPRFTKMVKPEYNKEMLANKTEGVVKVKVLIDIDGKVKKASALNDLGFSSAEQAVKATLEMEFTPALRGNEPVAVWIVIPIKFVMLG